MSQIESLLAELRSARHYTVELIDSTNTADWFRMPAKVTHVGWQVAHLAVAQYNLCLARIRGRSAADDALISPEILAHFGKGSVPNADAATNPSTDEIRAIFDRVHNQALRELAQLGDATLDEPVAEPHPRFTTKAGALAWAAQHERIHAGQIALLRRELGAEPLR